MPLIKDISYWSKQLGLLPINLSSTTFENIGTILLNGGTGDFCLQVENEIKDKSFYHSASWSSNTKNFVVIGEEKLDIYNWKKKNVEEINIKKIENNLPYFYEYLVSNNRKTDQDITPFIIEIFKQLRNLSGEKRDGKNSLELLFLLLITLENGNYKEIDKNEWGLDEDIYIPNGFENCIEILHKGISKDIVPKLDFLLRHSSGMLFQEAHREVIYFNKQFDLWGNLSGKIKVKKLMYSSIHYTPSYVARTIVENIIKNIDPAKPLLKILDPACGSAEFLCEILKQLKSTDFKGEIKIVGWDSSELAVNTSRFLLKYQQKEWDNISINIQLVPDSLKENWEKDFDVIVMNPPFVSYELMEKEARESVNETLGKFVHGRPNQASAFIYKATQSLKEGGILGCVTPSSIFSLSSYSNLRKELDSIITFSLIGKLGNFVFEDALTDVSIIIAKKEKKGDSSPIILWAKNEKGASSEALRALRKFENSPISFGKNKLYSIYRPDKFPITQENWKPISYDESEIIKTVERMTLQGALVRIQDVFNVMMGIRTGSNRVFKISNEYFNSLPQKEKKFFRPIVDNDAIKNGVISIKNYVWYPYSESGVLINSEEQLQNDAPNFYKIIENNKEELAGRSRKSDLDWWLLSEPLAWLRKNIPKLVSTEFGKAGSFSVDIEGKLLPERAYGWLPKKPFRHFDSNYFYLSIFSSNFFNKLLSVYSKQILSGYDLGKKSTKDIPIPSVHSEGIINGGYYEILVEYGKLISEGTFNGFDSLNEIVSKYIYNTNV